MALVSLLSNAHPVLHLSLPLYLAGICVLICMYGRGVIVVIVVVVLVLHDGGVVLYLLVNCLMRQMDFNIVLVPVPARQWKEVDLRVIVFNKSLHNASLKLHIL